MAAICTAGGTVRKREWCAGSEPAGSRCFPESRGQGCPRSRQKEPASTLFLCLILLFALAAQAQQPLTLDLVSKTNALVSPALMDVQWKPDSTMVSYIRRTMTPDGPPKDSLFFYDISSKKETEALDFAREKLSVHPSEYSQTYQWSPKGDSLLIQAGSDLWLFYPADHRLRRLTKDPEDEEFPQFSPSGDRIAFVKGNNLFAMDLTGGVVEQLTNNSDPHVLNGKLDWVYEEELARRDGRSYEWSPDGKKIVYLQLDENREPVYPLVNFKTVPASVEEQRYPNAGDKNAVPSLHIVTVGEPENKTYDLAIDQSRYEYVLPRFSWSPDSRAAYYITFNRPQNELTLFSWDGSAPGKEVFVEKDRYWINAPDAPLFYKDGSFLWLSERDGWAHLYRFHPDGRLIKQITRGDWQIDYGRWPVTVDQTHALVYFIATEKDPRERHIYRIGIDGGELRRLSSESGSHRFGLSPDGRYYVEVFSSVTQPPVTQIDRSDGSPFAVLDKPANRLPEYGTSTTKFVDVKAQDGAVLHASLTIPADFNPNRKYPVIVDVYGGPDAQIVQNAWDRNKPLTDFWTQQGFLLWSLDNRGSSGRGHAWETPIFHDMGKTELQDQLAGIAYLKSLPNVDPGRIAIYGWSYGGYMTLYALTHAPDTFRCGVAGAPVTDWTLYDSIYTERYMGTPSSNPDGYASASPLRAADKLKSRLLIFHGTSDDNVHMQNSMKFIDALIRARKPYEVQIQPGQSHGFRGETSVLRRNQAMLEFLKSCLL